jgi:colicin import membrane protein
MSNTANYLEFAPPRPPGRMPAFVLAIAAHLVLLGALAWGVSWKHKSTELAAEAELWASVPVEAAPKAVEAPPPPPPPPAPVVKEVAPPPAPVVKETDIALEREKEKKKLADEKKREEDLERKKAEALKKQEAVKEAQKKKQDQLKAAELKKKQQEEEDARQAEAQRQENLKRIAGMAGATGGPTATGNAQRAAGPSDSYGGRVRARVKPNIVFTDDVPGNPVAEVEVRTSPDGTIIARKIIKSSGVKAWDEAVLKAIDKTEVLPRDTDGRVPPALIIEFRPKG